MTDLIAVTRANLENAVRAALKQNELRSTTVTDQALELALERLDHWCSEHGECQTLGCRTHTGRDYAYCKQCCGARKTNHQGLIQNEQ